MIFMVAFIGHDWQAFIQRPWRILIAAIVLWSLAGRQKMENRYHHEDQPGSVVISDKRQSARCINKTRRSRLLGWAGLVMHGRVVMETIMFTPIRKPPVYAPSQSPHDDTAGALLHCLGPRITRFLPVAGLGINNGELDQAGAAIAFAPELFGYRDVFNISFLEIGVSST